MHWHYFTILNLAVSISIKDEALILDKKVFKNLNIKCLGTGHFKGKARWRYATYFRAWKRELDEKIALLRDSHPALLGKLGVNMNFRQLLGVIYLKNLRESVNPSPPWGAPLKDKVISYLKQIMCKTFSQV